MPRTFGSLSAYEPGLMDQARWWLQDTLTPVMGGDARRAGDFVQNKVMPTAEYLPGVGDAMAAGEAVDYFKQGQPIFGTLAAAGAMAGLVPGVGDAVQKGVKKGIRAYHGSPHDFDKFSLDKIGTGEGAQAYGHGLYFADSEDVARSYRDALAQRVTVDDVPILENNRIVGSTGDKDIDDLLIAHNGDLDAAIADEAAHVESIKGRNFSRDMGEPDRNLKKLQELKGRVESKNSGRMYEVNINANPDDFLDWDKPLSEQPESVRKAIEQSGVPTTRENKWFGPQRPARNPDGTQLEFWSNNGAFVRKTPSGFEYGVGNPWNTPADGVAQSLEEAQAAAQVEPRPLVPMELSVGRQRGEIEKQLREAGIPGIKYLDAGSRSAGDGSRNYVVFDDALIEILRKYGLAGLGIGVGAGGFGSLAPQDDNYQPPQL